MNFEGRILVIEDDDVCSRCLSGMLVGADYDVMLSPDGITALEVSEWYHPDVIILDLHMPFMDGWEFLEKYQQTPGQHVPIIVSSAGDINPASLSGIAGFLPKPLRMTPLLKLVAEIVN